MTVKVASIYIPGCVYHDDMGERFLSKDIFRSGGDIWDPIESLTGQVWIC